MKEASGELNMTVVTIAAIAAVGAFFYAFVWPTIQKSIANSTCKNSCPDGSSVTVQKDAEGKWQCLCDGVEQ